MGRTYYIMYRELQISWNPGTSPSQERRTARRNVLPAGNGPGPSPNLGHINQKDDKFGLMQTVYEYNRSSSAYSSIRAGSCCCRCARRAARLRDALQVGHKMWHALPTKQLPMAYCCSNRHVYIAGITNNECVRRPIMCSMHSLNVGHS